MTNEDKDLKKSLIEGVNSVLQIRLEELKYDEEKELALSSRYREVSRNFKQKIFGSAGAVALFLTALLPFAIAFGKGIEGYAWPILGLLLLDFALVGLTEYLFSRHMKRAGRLWVQLDNKYASAIALVNRQRVFLALRIDSIDIDQIRVFIPHADNILCQYRLEIVDMIGKVTSYIRSISYIKEALVYLSNRQKELIKDTCEIYEANKTLLEKEAEFISRLPSPEENFDSILEEIKGTLTQMNKSTKFPNQVNKEN